MAQCFSSFFAAAEPSAYVSVAHGTLCDDPNYNRIKLSLRISFQAISVCFGGTAGSHTRNPEVPRNPVEKHCSSVVNV